MSCGKVDIEELQRIEKSVWRQSAIVKDAIRDASGHIQNQLRARESFLLQQVSLICYLGTRYTLYI